MIVQPQQRQLSDPCVRDLVAEEKGGRKGDKKISRIRPKFCFCLLLPRGESEKYYITDCCLVLLSWMYLKKGTSQSF